MKHKKLLLIIALCVLIGALVCCLAACDQGANTLQNGADVPGGGDVPGGNDPGGNIPGGDDPAPPMRTFTVTFEALGGTPVDAVELPAGTAVGSSPYTAMGDCVFEGWYLSPGYEDGTAVEFPFEPTSDITLYARWNEHYTEGLDIRLADSGTEYIVVHYTGTEDDVVVPASYFGLPVTGIGDYAFAKDIFEETYIRTIALPETLVTIGANAFDGCKNLSAICIPAAVSTIEKEAFGGCAALSSVEFAGEEIATIGNRAFENCTALAQIVIPDSVYSLGAYAFYYCISLTDVTLGEQVSVIPKETFRDCRNLENVTVKGTVTAIYDSAFQGCSSLSAFEMKEGLLQIWPSAFENCTSLTRIELPASLSEIGEKAFVGCSSLSYVSFADPNGWMRDVIYEGKPITLGTPEENAVLLTDTYRNYYWHK